MFNLRNTSILLCVFLFFSLILNSCKKEDIVLIVGSNIVTFESKQSSALLNLSVRPSGTNVKWNVKSKPDWLIVTPNSGINNGQIETIGLSVNSSFNSAGSFSGELIIESDIAGSATVNVKLNEANRPNISTSTNNLSIGVSQTQTQFTIYNTGNTPLNWSLSQLPNYITASPATGIVKINDSMVVNLSAVKMGLSDGDNKSAFKVSTDFNVSVDINLNVRKFTEQKWMLAHGVVDAEFDYVHNYIIAIGAAPNKLYKINPESRTESTIDLPLAPSCISVLEDGSKAAIGCDGRVIIVNLDNMTIFKNYAVSADVYDIAYAKNNNIYISPRRDQWANILCLNLATGNTSNNTGNLIYERQKIAIHPSNNYLYTSDDNGLSPPDFKKLDIRSDVAAYLYDSPYHGDYDNGGSFWFSKDGNLIFSKSGNIFNASENKTLDMRYAGKIFSNSAFIKANWIEHAAYSKSIVSLVPQAASFPWDPNPATKLQIYSDDFFVWKTELLLQKFYNPNSTVDFEEPDGQFVFSKNNQKRVYVLMRNFGNQIQRVSWAIQTFDIP